MDKPTRRWLRFSLRTLLLLVTVACGAFGWLGYKMRLVERQRAAVEAIQKLGGRVYFAHDQGPAPGPAWLRKLLGEDFFATVTYVALSEKDISDSALAHLGAFEQLQHLY